MLRRRKNKEIPGSAKPGVIRNDNYFSGNSIITNCDINLISRSSSPGVDLCVKPLQEQGSFVFDGNIYEGLDHSGGTRKKYALRNVESNSGNMVIEIRDSGLHFRRENVVISSWSRNNNESLSVGMSKRSKRRLIKRTVVLEKKGFKPTHMMTVTLPPFRWEKLSNDYERLEYWKNAKKLMLDRLRCRMKSSGLKLWGVLWFIEFQKRGAPHIHFLMNLGDLDGKEWAKWLSWFKKTWGKAIKMDEMPGQAVDFNRMRNKDFRYCRNYASKLEQKNAPFKGNWGKWWSCMGYWNVKDDLKGYKSYEWDNGIEAIEGVTENEKVMNCIRNFVSGRANSVWIAWGLINVDGLSNLIKEVNCCEEFIPNCCENT